MPMQTPFFEWSQSRIAISFLIVLSAGASAAGLPPSLQKAFREAGVPTGAVAVYVKPVAAKQPTLAYRADEAMSPASTIKLLTTYAGLSLLGPAWQWQTEVYAGGPVEAGVLNGDLLLRRGGDPKWTLERLWLFGRELRARGVSEIRGDLLLDRLYWHEQAQDTNAFDGRGHRTYNVGPDAFLINFQSVRLRLVPNGSDVAVQAEPPLPSVRIDNRIKLDDAPCGDWRERLTIDVSADGPIQLAGPLARSCGERQLYLSTLDADRYLADAFRLIWNELGGHWQGKVRAARLAEQPAATLLFRFDSPPLAEVVRDINKFSNNTQARMLFLTLGGEFEPAEALAPKAVERIGGWLAGQGMSFLELVLENGSGLSRNERISARHLGQLLESATMSPVGPELLSSLPVVGIDGTMKKRLTDGEVTARAHIKTGSLEGVRAVAGVVHAAQGPVVVVAIVNHPKAGASVGALDAVVEWAATAGLEP